jgi:RNA polymerase sigma-70 factor (ECF subfamily)
MAAVDTAGAPPPRRELDDLSVARARRGDPAAARALVERYQHAVFALLSRLLGRRAGPARIEELAQDTFLRVFSALPGWSPAGPARLSTWILTIATRIALSELRRRPIDFAPIEAAADHADDRDGADRIAERRADVEALTRALAGLPADHRATLVLHVFHELSYEEIAVALECEVGTVKSRLSRAKARLKEQLSEVDRG